MNTPQKPQLHKHIVSVSLLVRMQQFVDNAIFNHEADAVPMDDYSYKKALKLRKDLERQLSKCNER
jgi:hypothetical protein